MHCKATQLEKSYSPRGLRPVSVMVKDASGNASTASVTVYLDLTGPVGALSANGYTSPQTATKDPNSIIVTPSATDSVSGVNANSYRFKVDNGDWTSASGPVAFTPVLTDGAHTIYMQTADNAGNLSAIVSTTVYVDSTAPALSLSVPNDWGTSNTVTADAGDGVSGIELQKWAFGRQQASYFADRGTAFSGNTFGADQNGIYTVYVKDHAGNETVGMVTVDSVYAAAALGGFTDGFTDLSIDSTGFDAEFSRVYDSANGDTGIFGKGWISSIEGSIQDVSYTYTASDGSTVSAAVPGMKIVKLPDGSVLTFHLVNGIYSCCNSRDTLAQSGDHFTLTTPDRTTYTFSAAGYLTAISDRLGNTETISVDTSGKPHSVTDTAGRSYALAYNGSGFVDTITDPIGRELHYGYENGNLASVTDPMGKLANGYSYDSDGYLSQIRDALSNVLESVTYEAPDGSVSGRIHSVTNEYGSVSAYAYDDAARTVTVTDATGARTATTYDALGNTTAVVDSDGSTTGYAYADAYGDISSVTDSDGTTSYEYDASGNKTKVTYPDGTTEEYTYDALNNVLSAKDTDGKMTWYVYDTGGYDNLIIEAVPKNGTDIYSTDADQSLFETTRYSYYSNGLVETRTDTDGTTVTYTYDGNGNVKTQASTAGTAVTYETNAIGWVKTATSSDGSVTAYDYNRDGAVIRQNAAGKSTRYIYDSYGRLIQEIDPEQYDASKDGLNDSAAADTYGDTNVGIRYTYDTHGKVLTKTDAKNNMTAYTYDGEGRLVKSVYNNTGVTRYLYNADGKLVQQINPDEYDVAKDGWNGTEASNTYADANAGYRFAYDDDGNVKTETYPGGQVFHFDSDGKVTSVDNPGGAAVSGIGYTYDDSGNIQTISEAGTEKVRYTYDSDSQLIREDNVWKNQTIVYVYDTRGNILSKTVYDYTTGDLAGMTPTNTDAYTYGDSADPDRLTAYDGKAVTYDDSGNMTAYGGWSYTWNGRNLSTADNSDNSVSYQYDADGIRTQKTVNGVATDYAVDADNNIVSETVGTDVTTYARDVSGNLLTMTLPNGETYRYEKNAQGDITGLLDSGGSEVVTYTYDSWGNLLSIGGSFKDTVGVKNPFRYRGYYYDTETGLFYVASRYYNPEIGRFISRDDASYHTGMTGANANLYAYCANNPVMRCDPDGHFWIFSQPWNSVNNMGFSIDVAITVIGAAIGIGGGVSTIRSLLARNAKGLIVQATRALLIRAGISLAGATITAIVNVLQVFLGFDIGISIARAWDSIDRHRNNGICDF